MRTSGILLPVFALSSQYGIGCFDQEAYHFIDNLKKAKQTLWQILPLNITSYGDSPYQSFSTYAGNPYYISLDDLVSKGYLDQEDLRDLKNDVMIDYGYLYETRYKLLKKAFLAANLELDEQFKVFCDKNAFWLEDYALFMSIKAYYNNQSWQYWDEDLRLRKQDALDKAKVYFKEDIQYHCFIQYLFWSQWDELKQYANKQGVQIIGDIPIYVAYDSCDVWSNPSLFQLNEKRKMIAVAGCPPDGFSATGQLWGNPLYNWPQHKLQNYAWWIERMKYCVEKYDIVRIDHFRGFDEYYSIPYGDTTAINGHWEQGPGALLFKEIEAKIGKMNVIAEDLGYVTESVKQMVLDCGYPGMKLLQFGFDSRDSSGAALYLPENYTENSVVYPGTHDNETMMGWFQSINEIEMQSLKAYLNSTSENDEELLDECLDLIMACVSNMCIVPMQDYLKLGNEARLNTPSTAQNNWRWRMNKEAFSEELIQKIRNRSEKYNRNN